MSKRTPAEERVVLTTEVIERFWSYVETTDTCWLWRGAKNKPSRHGGGGYGRITIQRIQVSVHRLAYFMAHGPISEGLHLDHLCRVRHCVNPDHLEPVANGVNVLRGNSPHAINARKTHCHRGHEFTPENTRIDSRGGRGCWICLRAKNRRQKKARYWRLKAERRSA